MKRSKMLAWMLLVVMLAGCMAFPAGAEGEGVLIFYVVAADDDAAWVRTDKGLMRFSSDGELIAGPLYPDAAHYALDPDGHIYYTIDGDIIEANETGAEVDRWETGIGSLAKICVNEKYILFTGSNSMYAVKEYGVIDKQTREVKGGVANGRLMDIAFCDEESFLLLQAGPGRLFRQKCSTLEELEQCSPGRYDGIALSEEGGPQYLYVENYIDRLQDFESELEDYLTLSTNNSINDIYMTDKTIWYVESFMLKNRLRSDLEAKGERNPEKTLYIMGQINFKDSCLQRAKELFEEEYPEYAVEIRSQFVNESVKTALMANEPGYDILLIDSNCSAAIKNSGFLADLSENEVILQNLESYIDMPFLWEEDGRLFGVPVFIAPYGLEIRKSQLEQIEGGIAPDWTWEDFAALADDAEEMGLCLVQENMFWKILLQQYTSVYCDFVTGEADYSNDTFRQLVAMWKELSDNGSICYDGSRRALLEYSIAPVELDPRERPVTLLKMPELNGKNAMPVYMYALYANAYSENADAAIRFLEIYSSVEVQRVYSEGGQAIFLSDLAMYDEYPVWKQLGFYPEEDFENWKSILSNGTMLERSFDQDQRIKELVTDLLNDKITVDEFVAEMQETADLMIGE
ncbi:MAG: extracellular solute-binding protein [Clostridiales bacterium]|nr:extracellular solute-binding protein [Clostridiales bacterium]